jgi:WD40 repeat protein
MRVCECVRDLTFVDAGVSWSRNGRKLLSASSDWTVKLWDVISGNVDQTLQLESAALFCQIHPRDPCAPSSRGHDAHTRSLP